MENKRRWYETLIAKIDKALREEYCFEAIFIEYMVIDDRIKSLCDIAGVSITTSSGAPIFLGRLITSVRNYAVSAGDKWNLLFQREEIADTVLIDSFLEKGSKTVISRLLSENKRVMTDYMDDGSGTKITAYSTSGGELLSLIQEWIDKRNTWMHQMADRPLTQEECEGSMVRLAFDGRVLCRELCTVVMKIKKNN